MIYSEESDKSDADWLAYWLSTDSAPSGCRAVETEDWRIERWGTDVLFAYEIVEDRWEESHWYRYTDVLRGGDRAPRREIEEFLSRDWSRDGVVVMRRRGVAGNRGIMFEAFESEGMGDDERKSDLDDPLDELVRLVENGVAVVYVDNLPMGDQPRVDYGEYGDEDPLVSPEEYDINAVVSDHHEMLMRMIETMLP